MSTFLQIILPTGGRLVGQEEILVEWGSEQFSSDPKRYRCKGFELTERPVPIQLAEQLPDSFRRGCSSLDFDPALPLRWGSGAIEAEELGRLQELFALLADNAMWAVFFEAGSGTGLEIVRKHASDVFDTLSPRVRRMQPTDVTIVLPPEDRPKL